MKLHRLGASVTALALTLSLGSVSAQAVRFPDVPSTFWGYTDINRMAERGYAKGYEDGTFRPNNKMTAFETLLFCARAAGIDSETQAKIAAARKEEMTNTLPKANNINVWAAAEMAVAVECGVLSVAELEALSQSDPKTASSASPKSYLEEAMTRENICMYLVRAMQLEPLAKSLSSYSLGYRDKDSISPALQPYVYVLTNYGIVRGKETGNFDPQGAVTRAEMTTMLCRALDFMQEAGIVVELSEYTSYNWHSGTITALTPAGDGSTLLTLRHELTGASQTFSIPAGAKVYKDNMLSSSSALEAGKYVRLNLNSKDVVQDIRIGGALSTLSGSVSRLSGDQLLLLVNGQVQSLTIDRFTQVSVGGNTGDRSLIESNAGYASAVCSVDEMGHLAAVRFSGGTRTIEGLIKDVSTVGNVTTLSVAAFNGTVYSYTVPTGIAVTVNGALGSLSANQEGKYAQLRVDTNTSQPSSISIDTATRYVQGPIVRLGTVGTAQSVTLRDQFTDKEVSFTVSQSAPIRYDGVSKTASQIQSGWYATVVVSNDMIVQMDAFPGSTVVEGTLSSITYDTSKMSTTLQVTQKNGSTLSYQLDITNLPLIVRNGKNSSIDQLRSGDTVQVTIRYNVVSKIESTPQQANLTGRITAKNETLDAVTISVQLSDGTEAAYTLSEGVSVVHKGASSNIHNLKPGYSIAMVTNGSQVISIEITSTVSSSTELTGTVLLTNSTSRTMMIQIADASGRLSQVTVDVKGATLMNQSTGDELLLSSGFPAGSSVRVFGNYDGATFVATIVIRQ